MTITKQILVTSLNKAVNKAKVSGKLDLKILSLYNLYSYYIDFTQDKEIYKKENKQFKELISELKYKYPDIICNYKLVINKDEEHIGPQQTAPTIGDSTIDLQAEYAYKFTLNDFIDTYDDAEQNPYNQIVIYPNTAQPGQLLYNNNPVLAPISFPLSLLTEGATLIYAYEYPLPVGYTIGMFQDMPSGWKPPFSPNYNDVNYTLRYRVSDDSIYGDLYSNTATINITNSSHVENFAPTIGDISITDANRSITVLGLEIFLTQMTPPYNDPEGDLIDAIRIDTINSANQGVFKLDGSIITEGTIITREQLDDDLFIHEGPNVDSITTDSITFSVRDEGSQTWVQ